MESVNVLAAHRDTLVLGSQAAAIGTSPDVSEVQRFFLRAAPAGKNLEARRGLILLIEDNPGDAGLVREALEEHGVEGELLLVVDGDRAIRYVRSLDDRGDPCPDLIIVDLNLPKRSGLEVLEEMGQTQRCSQTLAVVLSSSDTHQDKSEAMRLGARRYLPKPLGLDEFLNLGAIFRELLEHGSSRSHSL